VDNVQNCDLYTKTTFFDFLSVEWNVKGPEAFYISSCGYLLVSVTISCTRAVSDFLEKNAAISKLGMSHCLLWIPQDAFRTAHSMLMFYHTNFIDTNPIPTSYVSSFFATIIYTVTITNWACSRSH
jgi:hypothetical protein